ncbi:2-dehydropantoate 2-reductase [Pantoea sp. 1.19]|uniref:2-dehydropantoate 2-reductase n=1 Tax=Pantoea sp. 1.19 TaxID=1925589 RepID=UPI000948B555|nr:2-dehydropantoate 2-reductase [Pantoea sp. 1.19]
MNITVLGCGALGQIWLAALHDRQHQVQGWLRVPHAHCRVAVRTLSGQPLHYTLPANDPQRLAHCDLLLVTLKAWQVASATVHLLPHLPPDCPVLLLHNGLGTREELGEIRQPLLQGFTTHAARRSGQQVEHVAAGMTHIGPANARCGDHSALAAALQQALPDVAWHNDITHSAWQKLAVNCAINPLTVEYDCTNGALANYPERVNALCDEVAEVMAREGLPVDDLRATVWAVIAATAENTSSMLQDIRARRRTEIDYITGYLLRAARRMGIATPENSRLYERIKRKEQYHEQQRSGTDLSGTWHRGN